MTPTVLKTKIIAAENTFTDAIQLDRGQTAAISLADTGLSGGGASTWAATTVGLYRKFNATGDWRLCQSWAAPVEIGYVAECGMEIRIGVATGGLGGGDSVTIDAKTG